MNFAVGLCVVTIAFLHFAYAVPDPGVISRYNAERVPELIKTSAGIDIRYKLVNKTEGFAVGNELLKYDSIQVLNLWASNPVLLILEKTTLSPDIFHTRSYLVRLDIKGGYGNGDGRYGDFQLVVNEVTGSKSCLGSVQIAKALAKKQPKIIFDLMIQSLGKRLVVFVNPYSGM